MLAKRNIDLLPKPNEYELVLDDKMPLIELATAVRVTNLRLFAHEKFTIHTPKPVNYKYPYPISYQLFFLGGVLSLDPFRSTEETTARRLFAPTEARQTAWGNRESFLYEAALSHMQS